MYRTCVVILCSLVFSGLFSSNNAAISEEQKAKIHEKLEQIGVTCMKDNLLTEEDINNLRARKPASGPNAPCFLACMMKEMGIMNSEGKVEKESVLKVAKSVFEDSEEVKNVEEFLSSCEDEYNKDVSDGAKGCERAITTYTCMTKNSAKFGFSGF